MSKYSFETGQGMFKGTSFATLSLTTAAATGFASYPATIIRAFITVEGSAARYRYDGTDPIVTVGHLLNSGDALQILGLSNIQNFKAISTSGGATTMYVTYESDGR